MPFSQREMQINRDVIEKILLGKLETSHLAHAFRWEHSREGMHFWLSAGASPKLSHEAREALEFYLTLKPLRGFAAMDPERQKAIARKGGSSVAPEKRSFSKDPTFAKDCGRKGGLSVPDEKRAWKNNRALASLAGRKGGLATKARGKRP